MGEHDLGERDHATGLPLDFDELMASRDLDRLVASGEMSGDEAAALLEAAARRKVAEHGPAEDTDEEGRITTGGFGSGQGMGNQRTGQGPSGVV
jgi:hypothetical protein